MDDSSPVSGPSGAANYAEDRKPVVDGGTGNSNGTAAQPKRRRIHTACRVCQDRKTRCDGGRPACATCTRRGVAANCVYDSAAVIPAQYTLSAQPSKADRMGRYEPIGVRTLLNDVPNSEIFQNTTWPAQVPASATRRDPNEVGGPLSNGASSTGGLTPRAMHGSREVDGLALVASDDDEEEILYGSSSTIALARFCHGKAAGSKPTGDLATPDSEVRTSKRSASHVSRPEMIRPTDHGAAVIPPRPTADDFVRCFWEFIHPVFPVLHKTSFMQRYQRIWMGDQSTTSQQDDLMHPMDEATFSSTLNIVFAVGCQFSTLIPFENRSSTAKEFYQRSQRIYNFELLDSMSVPLVQMLVLTAVYLQSANNGNRCWNVVGLAIRVAQGLGLHTGTRKSHNQCQLEREMGRRIWHCLLSLDRLLSMTFGRPVMISPRWKVPFPSLIDDEYLRLQGEGAQPPDKPSQIGLCTYSSKLMIILDDVLSTFYSNHPDGSVTEMTESELQVDKILTDAVALNRRLDAFFDDVPAYLQCTGPANGPSPGSSMKTVELQRQILYCRFLHIRILLLRPMVHLTMKHPNLFLIKPFTNGSGTMNDCIARMLCNLCVTAASDLVEKIHQNLENAYRSWAWHSIYFTFGAAVVLLCANVCPAVDKVAAPASFEVSWNKCRDILEYYRAQMPIARRSLQTLQTLRESMEPYLAEPAANQGLDQPPPLMNMQMEFPPFSLSETGVFGDPSIDFSNAEFWGFH